MAIVKRGKSSISKWESKKLYAVLTLKLMKSFMHINVYVVVNKWNVLTDDIKGMECNKTLTKTSFFADGARKLFSLFSFTFIFSSQWNQRCTHEGHRLVYVISTSSSFFHFAIAFCVFFHPIAKLNDGERRKVRLFYDRDISKLTNLPGTSNSFTVLRWYNIMWDH